MSSKIASIILSVLLTLVSFWGLVSFSESTENEIRNRYELVNKIPLSGLKREVIDVLVLGQGPMYDNFVHLWTTQYLGSQELLQENPDILASQLWKYFTNIKSESFISYHVLGSFSFQTLRVMSPYCFKRMMMPDGG